jgi:hypothetical protein
LSFTGANARVSHFIPPFARQSARPNPVSGVGARVFVFRSKLFFQSPAFSTALVRSSIHVSPSFFSTPQGVSGRIHRPDVLHAVGAWATDITINSDTTGDRCQASGIQTRCGNMNTYVIKPGLSAPLALPRSRSACLIYNNICHNVIFCNINFENCIYIYNILMNIILPLRICSHSLKGAMK